MKWLGMRPVRKWWLMSRGDGGGMGIAKVAVVFVVVVK